MMQSTRVRIVSDPYNQCTREYIWDEGWAKIDSSYDSESGLINEELVKGFFPFKAKRIIDLIIEEFGSDGNATTIVFEGSDDEYDELQAICRVSASGGVTLKRSERTLPNARDVLPSIREIFNGIRPLMDDSILEKGDVASDMEKFYDASADLIPICVLGNYSAGKSTFVNALIGQELLPSGAQPITAKVFQITRSKQSDRAHIRFESDQWEIDLLFSEDGLAKNPRLDGIAIYDHIVSELEKEGPVGLIACMNHVVQTLNEWKESDARGSVSDLVRVEVPFSQVDAWTQDGDFVIFDTPGYNAASNADHARVLKGAMEGFSNGLLVYVAELHSLDAQDNANLCQEIRNFEAIDERFAMIVVNKADSAELPEEGFSRSRESELMSEFIPRNLFAQGIYFVSSVIGLGAKNDGKFISRNCTRVFHQQSGAYSDPDDPFYTTLYRYNMLPQQIKERTVADSESCQNVLLANSGLYCVEREMGLFATRYAAYNKCQQSLALLERLAKATGVVISEAMQRLENDKEKREASLERDKKELVDGLEEESKVVGGKAIDEYPSHMSKKLAGSQWFVTQDTLQEQERAHMEANQRRLSLTDVESARDDAIRAVGENFTGRVRGAVESGDFGSLFGAFRSVADDVNAVNASWRELGDTRRSIDRYASEALLAEVRAHFEKSRNGIEREIDRSSKAYWIRASDKVRNALFVLATGSTVLSEDKRKEIGELIVDHPGIEFPQDATEIFVKAQLGKGLELHNFSIVESERLNLRKLEHVFNTEIDDAFSEISSFIGTSHENAFRDWQAGLLGNIVLNITDYNPDLKNQVELIREDERRIAELTTKLETIEGCVGHVKRLIGWRE